MSVVPDMYKEYINSYVKKVSFVEQIYIYTTHTLLIFKYIRFLNVINKIQINCEIISNSL